MTAALLTEDQQNLRQAVRRCLERGSGPRPHLSGEPGVIQPFDTELWRSLAAEIGVAGLIVPEECDGAGGRFADLAVVTEELGRSLAPVPFFSTVALATTALLVNAEDGLARELLARIAEGGTTATLAFCEDDGSWDVDAAATQAERTGDGWRLSGRKSFVVDGDTADVLLVSARTDGRLGLFVVERGADGLRQDATTVLDLTRRLGTVTLNATPARLIGSDEDAGTGLRTALDLALVLLAVEQVGSAQHCLDNAVEYAKQRVQFGRPIGSFQAIKHTLVDVLLKVEMARSAAYAAVAAADEYLSGPSEETAHRLATAASLAKAMCADAFMHTAEETLHVYGGIGFTWEHDAHLYYRRAKASELFLGTPDQHRDRFAACAGLGKGRCD